MTDLHFLDLFWSTMCKKDAFIVWEKEDWYYPFAAREYLIKNKNKKKFFWSNTWSRRKYFSQWKEFTRSLIAQIYHQWEIVRVWIIREKESDPARPTMWFYMLCWRYSFWKGVFLGSLLISKKMFYFSVC